MIKNNYKELIGTCRTGRFGVMCARVASVEREWFECALARASLKLHCRVIRTFQNLYSVHKVYKE